IPEGIYYEYIFSLKYPPALPVIIFIFDFHSPFSLLWTGFYSFYLWPPYLPFLKFKKIYFCSTLLQAIQKILLQTSIMEHLMPEPLLRIVLGIRKELHILME